MSLHFSAVTVTYSSPPPASRAPCVRSWSPGSAPGRPAVPGWTSCGGTDAGQHQPLPAQGRDHSRISFVRASPAPARPGDSICNRLGWDEFILQARFPETPSFSDVTLSGGQMARSGGAHLSRFGGEPKSTTTTNPPTQTAQQGPRWPACSREGPRLREDAEPTAQCPLPTTLEGCSEAGPWSEHHTAPPSTWAPGLRLRGPHSAPRTQTWRALALGQALLPAFPVQPSPRPPQ